MMKIRFALTFLILPVVFTMPGFAQQQQIEVTSHTENNAAIFDAESNMEGYRTLVLKFTDLQGYKALNKNEVITIIRRGLNKSFFKMMQEEGSTYTSYQYTYTYYFGKYGVKPDMDYPYLLPATTGKNLNITQLENLSYKFKFGEEAATAATDSLLGVVFNYDGLDTIRAMRTGLVVEVELNQQDRKSPAQGVVYYDKFSQSIVTVEHADGSVVRYICLTPVNVLSKQGDRLLAGQPIAVFTKNEEYQRMGIHLFYLTDDLKSLLTDKIIKICDTKKGRQKIAPKL
ncbi:MAG: M23 family metallopeptidase [Candidatus Azobacteroides sp.]|nr:M23 family metallopeptidase [Candidatus Azobacteroides sp.]